MHRLVAHQLTTNRRAGMLSLKRKQGEAIYIEVPGYPPIVVRASKCHRGSVQLLLTADESVYIRREELVPEDMRVK